MIQPDVPIGDYGWIGDQRTGALVSLRGSIDWLCLPRFDSPAVFCSILGDGDDGFWRVAITDGTVTDRRYDGDTMVLITTWSSPTGMATVTDFMPPDNGCSDVVRIVECSQGSVTVEHELVMRFEYGDVVPWVRRLDDDELMLVAVAGPLQLNLAGPLPEGTDGHRHAGSLTLDAGERAEWVLSGRDAWAPPRTPIDIDAALASTLVYWRDWAAKITAEGDYADFVRRSLLVLRSLTHRETGGIVAAPSCSLPEDYGGVRNWDYRFTWLRDAALTLEALIAHGFSSGALRWRDWLLRAVAGDPEDLQIVYGLGGERDLTERELPHLGGYAGSTPVRIGQGAAGQYQADVVGEVMLALGALRDLTGTEDSFAWSLQVTMLDFLDRRFDEKDSGIWEVRGDSRYFTHGRVMMWAAFEQGLRAVAEHDLPGDVETWERRRAQLESEIWEHGFNHELNSFTQAYDNDASDASLLQIPQTGFVAYDHPTMLGTVARAEAELVDDYGFVRRYVTDGDSEFDGLTGHESPFVICTCWLVEQYAHSGRLEDARRLMDKVVAATTDLGLLAEEYDAANDRQVGNFPQAFSHLGLVRAADAIAIAERGESCLGGKFGTSHRTG